MGTAPDDEAPLGLRERKKRQARRAIRDAALRLFAERGVEAVSVDEIAAAADVSRATFFNYFPAKEDTITEPDPHERAVWARIRAGYAEAEPLWPAMTAVVLEGLASIEDSFVALRRIKASAPEMNATFGKGIRWISDDLRAWAEQRAPADLLPSARLQVNVALAALATAYEQWHPAEPFGDFLDAVRANLAAAGAGFDAAARPG